MEIHQMNPPQVLEIRPAASFAFIKVLPSVLASIAFLMLAYRFLPDLVWTSIFLMIFAFYRFIYIRKIVYVITPEIISWTHGIFLKRTDTVEMYRIKDYILTRPFIFQVFRLMDLTLRTTDPENPTIWLRGIPLSGLTDIIREHVQEARQHNRIYEIN